MKQHEAVIRAVEELGGFATLAQIYQKALSYPNVRWGTKTPQASIRRIVQKRPEFFKIRPGLWGLREHEKDILKTLHIGDETTPAQQEAFDHTYYQGIIVQWGNLLQCTTYVPPQDRNRLFLDKPLREFITTESIPPFTYPELVQRAGTVDVIWFSNSAHPFPVRMFEVEHTTDFHHSLIKFRHFLHFRTEFSVVASAHRKREFEEKLQRDHRELCAHVRFLNYEALVKVYSKDVERYQAYEEAGIVPL